jgi:6-pyruvoyltetrahydropterin/6-carboxytetrahydropterin synthase
MFNDWCLLLSVSLTICISWDIYAFDHKNLNVDVPEFKNLNPTAENIVVVIYDKLKAVLDSNLLLEVTLYETPRNFVTYSGQ